MPRTDPTSEKFQIAIFTCAFLAAGLALITLVLALFMNPSSASDVKSLEGGYQQITKLLAGPEMKSLRAQAKVSDVTGEQKRTLPEIVSDQMKAYGLDFSRFERATPKPVGAGMEEVRQPIDVKPAKLMPILQFIASVKDAKKSIQVRTVKIERDRKSKGDEDSWTANIEFVDYASK
jgi:hypothetical protein